MSLRKLVRFLPIVLLVAALAAYLTLHSEPKHTVQTATLPQAPPEPSVQLDEFGLDASGLQTVEDRIQRNETFSEILAPHGVSQDVIHLVAEKARPVFDVRGMQAGKEFRVYTDGTRARYVVYQQDHIEYVVFDLSDSVRVYEGQRPVSVEQRTISATIDGSLYGTLADLGADPQLAAKMAEVYAWQIDFYRIQKGDGFKVVYEQQVIDGEPVGLGNIVAAQFKHEGEDFFAFRFEQDGAIDYFDEKGESLRKAFLKSPLKFSRITSGYTMRRFHPVQKRWKAHLGTDYAAPTGTPIMATGDGVVLEAQFKRNNGNYVKIRHNGTYTTGYLHMSKIAKGIRPGARVRQGELIGYVGSTGLATGPHVCYRFWKNGSQIDPLKEKFPSANPVLDEHRMAFETLRAELMTTLTGNQPAYASVDGGEEVSALY